MHRMDERRREKDVLWSGAETGKKLHAANGPGTRQLNCVKNKEMQGAKRRNYLTANMYVLLYFRYLYQLLGFSLPQARIASAAAVLTCRLMSRRPLARPRGPQP